MTAPQHQPESLVAIQGVTKRFPGVTANDDVSLVLFPGEVHVLLGENGAGKSTLVGMLSGLQQPDVGTIAIGGRVEVIASPRRALALGIGTVFQHSMLVPSLSVTDNMALGGAWWRRPDRAGLAARIGEVCRDIGVKVDPEAVVGSLSLGERQQVEIVRALLRGSRVLLLDEATAMLTLQGAEDLGALMRRLVARDLGVVFITHKLNEALTYGDRVSVLRLGRKVGELGPADLASLNRETAMAAMVRLMFGADATQDCPSPFWRGARGEGRKAWMFDKVELRDSPRDPYPLPISRRAGESHLDVDRFDVGRLSVIAREAWRSRSPALHGLPRRLRRLAMPWQCCGIPSTASTVKCNPRPKRERGEGFAPPPSCDSDSATSGAGISIEFLSVDDPTMPVADVSLSVAPGEILGIAGIDGNGQKQLAEAVAGQRPVSAGTIHLDGRRVEALDVAGRHALGLRYVTDDRLGEGTVAAFSVATNLVLKEIGAGPFWVGGWERPAAIDAHACELVADFDVRTPDIDTPIGTLSGGNIQRALLARELSGPARALIFAKPTSGLDVQNSRTIRGRIRDASAGGVAILLISTDLEEILELSDRIAVMAKGRIVGTVPNDEAARARVGETMSGP